MNRFLISAALPFLLAGPLGAADASAKDELLQAAHALASQSSYAWTVNVEVPPDAQFRPGPSDGKCEKDGYLMLTTSFGGGTAHTVKKGDQIALTDRDGAWQSIAELEADTQGFGRFRANMARNLQPPAEDAVELIGDVVEVQREGNVYAGNLTEDGAKAMMSFGGRRSRGQGGPEITGAKGSARFWVTDGVLSKMEVQVAGTMSFNGNDMEMARTTTTTIKDVGTTKVEIPEGAKAKLP